MSTTIPLHSDHFQASSTSSVTVPLPAIPSEKTDSVTVPLPAIQSEIRSEKNDEVTIPLPAIQSSQAPFDKTKIPADSIVTNEQRTSFTSEPREQSLMDKLAAAIPMTPSLSSDTAVLAPGNAHSTTVHTTSGDVPTFITPQQEKGTNLSTAKPIDDATFQQQAGFKSTEEATVVGESAGVRTRHAASEGLTRVGHALEEAAHYVVGSLAILGGEDTNEAMKKYNEKVLDHKMSEDLLKVEHNQEQIAKVHEVKQQSKEAQEQAKREHIAFVQSGGSHVAAQGARQE